MNRPIVLLSGGSSGIGAATAKALTERGCRVYELSRRASEQDGIIHLTADLTDEESVKAAVTKVLSDEGHIDILINNAGFGISGAVEMTDTEDAKRLFDVNFFGMVRLTKAVLPAMRQAGGGRIVNISSVAAVVPIPFQTYYSAAKAAINSYTMATANEIAPFGISMCAVMPGDIRSGFTDAREKSVAGDDIYGGKIKASVGKMEHDERTGMAPEKAAAFIASVALRKRKKPLYAIGFGYRAAVFLTKILPAGLLNRLIAKLYT